MESAFRSQSSANADTDWRASSVSVRSMHARARVGGEGLLPPVPTFTIRLLNETTPVHEHEPAIVPDRLDLN